MSRFLSERFMSLVPYTPGEQPTGRIIKLNTNESPFPPSPAALAAIEAEAHELMLYPDPMNSELASAMAEAHGVSPENIFTSNGSDETLAFIFEALCPNGAAFADLSYGFYSVYAAHYGVDAKIIPLREDYSLAPEDYVNLGRTIFIANPNAPTGMAISREEIEFIVRSNPEGLVVIDEAYVDFGGESAVPLTKRYANLIVVGTFSKSRNLAGARLGYAIADSSLITDLKLMKFSFNPYNVNRLTAAAGVASLRDRAYFDQCVAKIIENREYTAQKLDEIGLRVLPSRTNFVFASPAPFGISGSEYFSALRERGILVRHFDVPRGRDFARITIGKRQDMDALIECTRKLIEEGS